MTKTGWLGLLIIIVVVAAGLFLWWNSAAAPIAPPTASDTASASLQGSDQSAPAPAQGNSGTAGAPMSAAVTYDGANFSPASVAIAQGGTVTFTDTAGQMWVASNPHPVHDSYDGTSISQHCEAGYSGPAPFDECSPGTNFSFTFNKAGTWGYHDHLNHGATGSVTVVAQ